MTALAYRIVDVFAARALEGNPLAVVTGAAGLDGASMLRIANEFNLSETTFVTGGSAAAGFDVRIFTPRHELSFAGHPTLGTAAVLRPGEGATLNLAAGAVPVEFEPARGLYWLTAPPVQIGDAVDTDAVLAVTGLAPDDLDPSFRPRRVRGGPEFVFVPLASPDALSRCGLDLAHYRRHFPADTMPNIYAFARARGAGELVCRLFFDTGGVREDPATGSAAACLGHYLLERRYLGGGDVNVRLSQGAQMGRPSTLFVQARARAGGYVVRVGGQVHNVAAGTFDPALVLRPGD